MRARRSIRALHKRIILVGASLLTLSACNQKAEEVTKEMAAQWACLAQLEMSFPELTPEKAGVLLGDLGGKDQWRTQSNGAFEYGPAEGAALTPGSKAWRCSGSLAPQRILSIQFDGRTKTPATAEDWSY